MFGFSIIVIKMPKYAGPALRVGKRSPRDRRLMSKK